MTNNPVLKIDLLLDCGHIVTEQIDGVIFQPHINDKRTCSMCKTQSRILKVGVAWWDYDGNGNDVVNTAQTSFMHDNDK